MEHSPLNQPAHMGLVDLTSGSSSVDKPRNIKLTGKLNVSIQDNNGLPCL